MPSLKRNIKKGRRFKKKVFELNKARDNLIRDVAPKEKSWWWNVKKLNPILGKYMEENNISVVIDKKNVLMGNKKFEIILKLLKF